MMDRGQMYGDGFFETMLSIDGVLPLIHYHFERMVRTAKRLNIDLPEVLCTISSFKNVLAPYLRSDVTLRIRLNVIRSGNGFYLPISNVAQFNINSIVAKNPLNEDGLSINNVEIAETISIYSKGLSNYKTLSKSDQVLMSLECKERALDDLILLNEKEEITECIYSNIFFVHKNGHHVTPRLDSGCLDGCMRRFMLDNQSELNIVIKEETILVGDLKDFESCYCTNSISGIKSILRICNHYFSTEPPFNYNLFLNMLLTRLIT